MKRTFLLLVFFFPFFALPSFAIEATDHCISQSFIEGLKQKVSVEIVGESSGSFDRCDQSSKTYQLYRSLESIRNLRFSSKTLRPPFSQGLLQGGMWEFLISRVKTFREDTECQPGVRAYVTPRNKDGVISLCPDFFAKNYSLYRRMESLLHEARHFDGRGHFHIQCAHGPRKFRMACDGSLKRQGSYAVSVEVYARLALTALGLTKKEKYSFKKKALSYAAEAFYAGPPSTAVYLKSESGQSYVLHNKKLKPISQQPKGIYSVWAGELIVLPEDRSDAYTLDLLSKTPNHFSVKHDFLRWYNSQKTAMRPQIKDILVTQHFGAFLVGEGVDFGHVENEQFSRIVLPERGLRFLSPEELGLKHNDNKTVFVATESGKIYRVVLVSGRKKVGYYETSETLPFQSIIAFAGGRYALTRQGELKVREGESWKTAEFARDLKFSYVSRPFLWSEYFVD